MTAGSTPAVDHEAMRASGSRPRLAASAADIKIKTAAPSLMPEALAAVTVPSLEKAGRSFCTEFECHALLDVFIVRDDHIALAAGNGHGANFILELAGGLRGFGFVLRGNRKSILLIAGDLPLLGNILSRGAHVIAVEGIPQAVLDHGVDEVPVTHFHAIAQMRGMGRLRHGFLTTCGDDLRITRCNLLHAQCHGAKARTANLVQAPGRCGIGNAGMNGGLAGWVLALGRC